MLDDVQNQEDRNVARSAEINFILETGITLSDNTLDVVAQTGNYVIV